jgi:uncharacterized protein (DUF305 family)
MKKMYIAIALVIALGVGVSGGLLTKKSPAKSSTVPAGTTATSDHMSMSADALKNLTGDAYDKMFITMMSEHHAGAVAMAGYVTSSSKPEIKELANTIIAAQTKELADMKSWATKWGYRQDDPDQQAIANMSAGVANKTGDALDEQFLSDMIGHHQSALAMAQYSKKNAKHQEIVDLSSNIEKTQTAEIMLMKSIESTYGYSTSHSTSMSGMSM